MDFAYQNGMDALALTDHGNMNGLAYQVMHAKKMSEEGKDFKPIFGLEAYFIPSIDEWRLDYDRIKEERANSKGRGKSIDGDVSGVTVEVEEDTKSVTKNITQSPPPHGLAGTKIKKDSITSSNWFLRVIVTKTTIGFRAWTQRCSKNITKELLLLLRAWEGCTLVTFGKTEKRDPTVF